MASNLNNTNNANIMNAMLAGFGLGDALLVTDEGQKTVKAKNVNFVGIQTLSGDKITVNRNDPLDKLANTGLPEGSLLRFKAQEGRSKDFSLILMKQVKKVNEAVAEKLQKSIDITKNELSKCRDEGCPCSTPTGQIEWINQLILNFGSTAFDKTGIGMLLAKTDLSREEQQKYAAEFSKFPINTQMEDSDKKSS